MLLQAKKIIFPYCLKRQNPSLLDVYVSPHICVHIALKYVSISWRSSVVQNTQSTICSSYPMQIISNFTVNGVIHL